MTTVGFFHFQPRAGLARRLGLYGAACKAQGATIHHIVCDGVLPRCLRDQAELPVPHRTANCTSCWPTQWRLATLDDPDTLIPLSRLVDAAAAAPLLAAVAALPAADLTHWSFDGLPVGEWLRDALRLEYGTPAWRQEPDWPNVARGWLGHMVVAARATENYVARHAPDTLVVVNGRVPGEAAVMGVANRLGVRCVADEGGMRPATLFLSTGRPACDYVQDEAWRDWADVPLTTEEEADLEALFAARRRHEPQENGCSPAETGDVQRLRQALDLGSGPVIAVFPGVANDTAVFGADTVFADQAAWLDACIRYAEAHPLVPVVVRSHPIELQSGSYWKGRYQPNRDPVVPGIRQRWSVLPPNLRLIDADDPLSSYDLLALATVVCVYIGTLGIEATMLGKPVVVGGRCHYRNAGFADHLESLADLDARLDAWLARPQVPERTIEAARRYMYFCWRRTSQPSGGFPHDPLPLTPPDERPVSPCDKPEWAPALARISATLLGQRPWVRPPGHDDGPETVLVLPGPNVLAPGQRPAGKLTICYEGGADRAWQRHLASPQARATVTVVEAAPGQALPASADVDDRHRLWVRPGETPLTPMHAWLTLASLMAPGPMVGLVPVVSWTAIGRFLSFEPRWLMAGQSLPDPTGPVSDDDVRRLCLMPGVALQRLPSSDIARMPVVAQQSIDRLRAWLRLAPGHAAWHVALAASWTGLSAEAALRHRRHAHHLTLNRWTNLPEGVVAWSRDTLTELHRQGLEGDLDLARLRPLRDGPSRHASFGVVLRQGDSLDTTLLDQVDRQATRLVVLDGSGDPAVTAVADAYAAVVVAWPGTGNAKPMRDGLASDIRWL